MNKQIKVMLLALAITTFMEVANGLQVMLKNGDWYCFTVSADRGTVLEVDYLVTGMNPEMVDFEARQSNEVIKGLHGDRSSAFEISSTKNAPIDLCWSKKDKKSKKLDFSFKRNMPDNSDAADQ